MCVCVCVCVCFCVCVCERERESSMFSFKQVRLNKIESVLFWIFKIFFFQVTILKFLNDFSKGAICVIPITFSSNQSNYQVNVNVYF